MWRLRGSESMWSNQTGHAQSLLIGDLSRGPGPVQHDARRRDTGCALSAGRSFVGGRVVDSTPPPVIVVAIPQADGRSKSGWSKKGPRAGAGHAGNPCTAEPRPARLRNRRAKEGSKKLAGSVFGHGLGHGHTGWLDKKSRPCRIGLKRWSKAIQPPAMIVVDARLACCLLAASTTCVSIADGD